MVERDVYDLCFPDERDEFCEIMDKFPGVEVMKSNPQQGQAWHRAACIALMKRAVANLELFEQVAKDHSYFKGFTSVDFAR